VRAVKAVKAVAQEALVEREAIAEEEAAAVVEVRSCRIINVAVRQEKVARTRRRAHVAAT
jgi:hypothetical protein